MSASVDMIRVDRLMQFLPFEHCCDSIGIEMDELIGAMPNAVPVAGHVPYSSRDFAYHVGRVKHFIESGIPSPIVLDNVCGRGSIYPVPVLLDGHHRFLAAMERYDEFIPCHYGGRTDLLLWLTGESDDLPDD
jgi:hypothetical protein